ncbi:MAG: arylsulfatase [Bacteroidales bacterium]
MRFFRKELLLGLAAVPFTIPQSCRMEPIRPNIIYILADDLGYGDLCCYGATKVTTPNCDRLAKEGMRFTDAHSSSAVSTPTRYGILTGQYCWRSWLKNWVLWENMPLLIDTSRLTVASMLKQVGYTTGCIGKWHLGWGNNPDHEWTGEVKPGPREVGFDYYFGVPHSHNSPAYLQVFMENSHIVGLNPGEDLHDEAIIKRVQRNPDETAINLSDRAVRFIEDNKDKPFFLYYPVVNIHSPLTPNPRFQGKSDAGLYGDFIAEFDWAVGEILETLDRLGLSEKTIIILTSDNGASSEAAAFGLKSNAPWRGEKCQIYEGGHRVPFIVRWPGKIKPGTISDETTCLTDFMATSAAIVGYTLPGNAAEDSYNMLPVLLGKKIDKPVRESTIHHSLSGMFAIRQGKWKLIEGLGDGGPEIGPATDASAEGKPEMDASNGKFKDLIYYFPPPPQPAPGDPEGQLYDLENDPGETKNLWNEQPEIVLKLQQLLEKTKRTESDFDKPVKKSRTVVTIKKDRFYINDQITYPGRFWKENKIEGLLMNSRMVQGIFDDLNPQTINKWIYPDTRKWDPDRNSNEFVLNMKKWYDYGLLSFTINLQGGSPQGYSQEQPWLNSAYTYDGKLRPEYMERLERILNKADEIGMVPILGLFYFGQDQRLQDETAIMNAIDHVLEWLFDRNYRNILIEINNECNVKYDHDILKPDRVHELIEYVKRKNRNGFCYYAGTSYGGRFIPLTNVVKASDFILLHGNGEKNPDNILAMVQKTRVVPGYTPKPILFNEDDHFDFNKDWNNFTAAVTGYASWGYFDYRMKDEPYEAGYQSIPVDWGINSERKKSFFNLLKQITGY